MTEPFSCSTVGKWTVCPWSAMDGIKRLIDHSLIEKGVLKTGQEKLRKAHIAIVFLLIEV
jgi:hypothetical protein